MRVSGVSGVFVRASGVQRICARKWGAGRVRACEQCAWRVCSCECARDAIHMRFDIPDLGAVLAV